MIDISAYSSLPALTGIFNSVIITPVYSDNFQIIRMPKRNYWVFMTRSDDYSDPNNRVYSDDNLLYLTEYCKELLNIDFNSILIAGLGLGNIPYQIKNHLSCSIIDVIDNNQEIINLTMSAGYLDGVSIINEDVFNYIPTKTYDIILLDIWLCAGCIDNMEVQISTLVTKYLSFLNEGGFVYVPINVNSNSIFKN